MEIVVGLVVGLAISALFCWGILYLPIKKYIHTVYQDPPRVPVLPYPEYSNHILGPRVLALILGALISCFVITYITKEQSDPWGIPLASGIFLTIIVLIYASRVKMAKNAIFYLRIEGGTIYCTNRQGIVLRSFPAERVAALKLCDVTYRKYGARYYVTIKKRYIALLSSAYDACVPSDIREYTPETVITENYILVAYAPETLALLQSVLNVPILEESAE